MADLTSFPSDTLLIDLLARITLVEKVYFLASVPYQAQNLYESVNGPYPSFYNFHWNTGYDYSNGANTRADTIDINVRLIGGPIASGVFHQNEDVLNRLTVAVANMFSYRKWLEDPTNNNQPFQYMSPYSSGTQMLSASRINGLTTEKGTTLLGVDFKLRCPMLVTIPRLS